MRRWGELGALVTVEVVLHVAPVRLDAGGNRVPRPLRAGRESSFPGSVCQELDFLPSLPVLHPLEVPCKVQDGRLEALLSQLLVVLAKSVTVPSPVVGNDSPANLLGLASLPLSGYNARKFVILSSHPIAKSSARTIMQVRISNRAAKRVPPSHSTWGEHRGASGRPPRMRLRVVVPGVGVGVSPKPLR